MHFLDIGFCVSIVSYIHFGAVGGHVGLMASLNSREMVRRGRDRLRAAAKILPPYGAVILVA